MQRLLSGTTALGLALMIATAVMAACGSPTPEASSTAPVADTVSPVATISAADATATAGFEATNRKLALGGQPTFAPGTDPDHPYANITYPPSTPWPTPTLGPPRCAETIAGWEQVLAQYGPWYEKFGCGPINTSVGAQIVLMTVGKDGGPGAIVTYTCEPTDARCLAGLSPSAPGASWSVYPAPFPGGVGVVGGSTPPDCLRLGAGHWFNLATHLYDDCK